MSTERNKEQAGALKQYEYTDAVETAKAYFKGDDLAATVWVSKYALKDSMGKIYENSPEQMHRRIAREIERIEKRYPNPMSESEVYDLLKDKLNIAKITFSSGVNAATQEYQPSRTIDRCPLCGIALNENGVCPKCGYKK